MSFVSPSYNLLLLVSYIGLQHMLEPLTPKMAARWLQVVPRLEIDLKWCPKSMISYRFKMCFCVTEETQHTPQSSMDFPVSFASTGRIEGGV